VTEEANREVLKVWPSSLPRINDCAASAYPSPGITITQPSGPGARVGIAIHALAAQIVRENLNNCPDATGYAVDRDVYDKLTDITIKGIFAAQTWKEIRGEFDQETVQVEAYGKWSDEEGEGPILTMSGYRDVQGLLTDGVSIGIIDWKSGMPDLELVDGEDDADSQILVEGSDSIHQLKGYAKIALEEHPDRDLVRLYLVWLSERYYLLVTYTRDEINEWWNSMQYKIRSWDKQTFSPGVNCRWCRWATGCPGREKYMGVAVKAFDRVPVPTTGRSGLAINDPQRAIVEQRLARAYAQCQVLESHIEIFKANLKQEIAAGGPVPLHDDSGKAIGLINVTGKTVIDLAKGWDEILAHLGGSEAALRRLCTISTSTLKTAVRDGAEKGDKQKAVDELIAALEGESAVIYKPGYQRFGLIKHVGNQPAIDI